MGPMVGRGLFWASSSADDDGLAGSDEGGKTGAVLVMTGMLGAAEDSFRFRRERKRRGVYSDFFLRCPDFHAARIPAFLGVLSGPSVISVTTRLVRYTSLSPA